MRRPTYRCSPIARALAVIALAVAALVSVGSSPAHACEPTTVCLRWKGDFEDSGAGEDILAVASLVKASGARVTVVPPVPEMPFTTSLDAEGCVTFETQFSYGHKFSVYADALVEGVRLRPAIGEYNTVPNEYPLFRWEVHAHGLVPGGTAYGQIAMEADAEAGDTRFRILPMMASATQTLQRFAELGIMPPNLAADETITLSYTPGFGNARCACSGGSQSRVEVGPDSFTEKFLMAHELGHWLQARWSTNGSGPKNYFYPPGDGVAMNAPCQFEIDEDPMLDVDVGPLADKTDGGLHGIRSAEWSSAGIVEGYAHFLSGLVFNDPASEAGYFRYYKDIVDENHAEFLAAGSRVALHGGAPANTVGGASRWVELQCPDDWAFGPNDDELTSGMDWMRFWWRFTTDQPVPADLTPVTVVTFVSDVQNAPGFAWTEFEVWNGLSAAAADPDFEIDDHSVRFNTIADEQGVDNDQ